MKIYNMQNARTRRDALRTMPERLPVFKKAAGSEDRVMLSIEAMERFQRDNDARDVENMLIRLAMDHINDPAGFLEDLDCDHEFRKAERLCLVAELAIRVAPSVDRGDIYSRVSSFILEQL